MKVDDVYKIVLPLGPSTRLYVAHSLSWMPSPLRYAPMASRQSRVAYEKVQAETRSVAFAKGISRNEKRDILLENVS